MLAADTASGPRVAQDGLSEKAFLLGALIVVMLSFLQFVLVSPVIDGLVAESPTASPVLIRTLMWLAAILSPLAFVVVACFMGAFVWAVGVLCDQDTNFRQLLNIAAYAELCRAMVATLIVLAWRFGTLSGEASWLLGSSIPHVGDTVVDAVLVAMISPALWSWGAALGILLHTRVGWSARPAILSVASLVVFRAALAGLRIHYGAGLG